MQTGVDERSRVDGAHCSGGRRGGEFVSRNSTRVEYIYVPRHIVRIEYAAEMLWAGGVSRSKRATWIPIRIELTAPSGKKPRQKCYAVHGFLPNFSACTRADPALYGAVKYLLTAYYGCSAFCTIYPISLPSNHQGERGYKPRSCQ